jgi:hypothetical protein
VKEIEVSSSEPSLSSPPVILVISGATLWTVTVIQVLVHSPSSSWMPTVTSYVPLSA